MIILFAWKPGTLEGPGRGAFPLRSGASATFDERHLINMVDSCILELKSLPSRLCLKKMPEAFIMRWDGWCAAAKL